MATLAEIDQASSSPGWLAYTNQNATRNQPLAPELVQALSFLPQMGVRMEVFSGGQPSEGANRTGSHRHDHGNAGDVFFYDQATGRRLDWNNPADVPRFQEIVRRAQEAGVTGFGAGEGYMQPGSMHIGYGPPAVWGDGGSGANAAPWLAAAFDGTQRGGNAPTPTPLPQTQAMPQNNALAALAPPPQQSQPEWRNSLSAQPFMIPTGRNALYDITNNPFMGAPYGAA